MAERQGPWSDTLRIENPSLAVTLHAMKGMLEVTDKRCGRTWSQQAVEWGLWVTDAGTSGRRLEVSMLRGATGLRWRALFELDEEKPELLTTIESDDALTQPLGFPHPFTGVAGTYLAVPLNEGVSYPAEDGYVPSMRLAAYSGAGLCMAFWGVTDGTCGHMGIIETPDDAAIRIDRSGGLLCVTPEWEGQLGRFAYARRLRYVFFDQGGHVAMCKRYRAYAAGLGRLRTLAEKREANPDVDLLVGAVNVWSQPGLPADEADAYALRLLREMQAAGIDRILWSSAQSADIIRTMNQMGVLTSRYDQYQDVMDPSHNERLQRVSAHWPAEAWPRDIITGRDGAPTAWWSRRGKDGRPYVTHIVCDSKAVAYARRRIPEELRTKPYRCRFLDTTLASPYRECYDPNHPMTRTESVRFRNDLLRLVGEELNLVTGSETGHDAAAPFVHYLEGMLSLVPYRLNDPALTLVFGLTDIPERLTRFQMGHAYRLPLWELVYHDCVIAQWYWGDFSNKFPSLWDKRDLFNVLYGTPPMFIVNQQNWPRDRDRFVQGYRSVCPVARATGYAEMVGHRFLAPDRSVQETTFANGVVCTVNFSDKPFETDGPEPVGPMGFRVKGIG